MEVLKEMRGSQDNNPPSAATDLLATLQRAWSQASQSDRRAFLVWLADDLVTHR